MELRVRRLKAQLRHTLGCFLRNHLLGPDFLRLPSTIIMEPTNACNLRCPVCPTHIAMQRHRGFMSFELFKSVVDEFKELDLKPRIDMGFAGEPLLNAEVCRFVEYASRCGHPTQLSTNATRLSSTTSERLIRGGLQGISLCLDGITKEAHEAYRIGSQFEVVQSNIEGFLRLKARMRARTPVAMVQVLLTSLSEGQREEILSWARAAGADGVKFKSLSMGSYTSEEIKRQWSFLVPKDERLRRGRITRKFCSAVLSQSLVYWNGDMGLCCVDFDNEVQMGNVTAEGFLNAWRSQDAIDIRRRAYSRDFGLCGRCGLVDSDFSGYSVRFT
ncbi:MAG: radical SAM protein [Armatimonadetes bacterium]|nr:radical SAM protein [Armatimonadota bacterium]